MPRNAIEIVAADDEMEQIVLDAIGPRRTIILARWGRPRRSAARVVGSIGLIRAESFFSIAPFELAQGSEWGGCLAFVGPDTPVEALSDSQRIGTGREAALQFISIQETVDFYIHVRGTVERLDRGRDSERVLHAWSMGGVLELLTTRFERPSISRQKIPELRGIRNSVLRNVEVNWNGESVVIPSAGLEFDSAGLLYMARGGQCCRGLRRRSV